jgi:hypothetical protein
MNYNDIQALIDNLGFCSANAYPLPPDTLDAYADAMTMLLRENRQNAGAVAENQSLRRQLADAQEKLHRRERELSNRDAALRGQSAALSETTAALLYLRTHLIGKGVKSAEKATDAEIVRAIIDILEGR